MNEKALTHDGLVAPITPDALDALVQYAGYRPASDGVYVAPHQFNRYEKTEIPGTPVSFPLTNRESGKIK